MDAKEYMLKMTFTESLLGTIPQKAVAEEFILAKAAGEDGGGPEDELRTAPEELERGTTAFHRLSDGMPILYDYAVKGFLKEAAQVFNGLRGVKALRSKIDNLVFIQPRQIALHLPEGGAMTYCDRPLRAMTAQGPRVSLARSEELPVGTWFECRMKVYDGPISEPLLRDLLTYGADKGMGQWRNGGHGRFTFELTDA